MKKIHLSLFVTALVMLNSICLQSKAQTILMQETFTGNVLPTGWYEDSAGVNPVIPKWKFTGGPNGITGWGFDTNYLRIFTGSDRSLNTNIFNTIGFNSIYLTYGEYYVGYLPPAFMRIEVSSDSGLTWNVAIDNLYYNHSPVSTIGNRKVVDLSVWAANKPNVKIRFHGNYSILWAIDSVVVSDSAFCTMPTDTSGVVVGDRKYACMGALVNLHLASLSRGIGQTYQWQVKNAANGNVFTDIAGATADTLVYAQNGLSTYKCNVTCLTASQGSTNPLTIVDTITTPGAVATLHSLGLCSTNDTLYLVTPTTDPAIIYQWAVSNNTNSGFTDIAGANDTLYAVNNTLYTGTKFFRCKQVCASSGRYNISQFWPGFINYNPDCYCLGYNENTCTDPFFSGGIVNVSISGTTLNNPSATCSNLFGYTNLKFNYTYFPAVGVATGRLNPGATYTLSVTLDTLSQHDVGFWIDYNHNGTFDVNEWTAIAFPAQPGIPTTAQFTVPFNAPLGQTALRIRSALNFPTLNAGGACTSYYGGETEDYVVTIDTATAVTDLSMQQGLQLQVYPNPISDKQQLTVVVGSSSNKVNTVEIITMEGCVVLKKNFTGNLFTTQNNFAPGLYAVKVITGGEVLQKRLVVVR